MERYFNTEQISIAGRTFSQAEKMAGRYFRIGPAEWKERRYDVKTLAFLEKHEVREGAFAHLCKYQFRKKSDGTEVALHFYRICLQDDRILDAVEHRNAITDIASVAGNDMLLILSDPVIFQIIAIPIIIILSEAPIIIRVFFAAAELFSS